MSVVTVEELKASIKAKTDVSGVTFVNVKGSQGTVLPGKSDHGKLRAEMTCVKEGCTETHIREISDFHQCGLCRTHSKTKAGGGAKVSTGVRLDDGTVVRYQPVLATDDAETVELKAANNLKVEELRHQKAEQKTVERLAKELERKQRQETAKADREAKAVAEKKQKLADMNQKIREYAQRNQVPVSVSTLQNLDEQAEALAQ